MFTGQKYQKNWVCQPSQIAVSFDVVFLVFPKPSLLWSQMINIPNFQPLTNSSDAFTNLFHELFPQIFSVWAVEKENKILIGPKQFFSQFASWKRNHNRYSLNRKSNFEISETIWWIRTLLPNETDSFKFINLEFLLVFLDDESILFLSRAIAIEFSSGTCRLERLLSLCRCGAISGVTARGRFWLLSKRFFVFVWPF